MEVIQNYAFKMKMQLTTLCYLAIALTIFKMFVLTSFSLQTILNTTGQRPVINSSTNLLTNKPGVRPGEIAVSFKGQNSIL